MRQFVLLGWIFAVGLAFGAETGNVAAAGETVKVASIEGVTEYRLVNGHGCCSFLKRRGRL